MALRILHTNDLHGMLTDDLAHRLAPIRQDADLYFDTGDVVKAGNLAIPLHPDAAWPHLAELGCTASVPGNRESQILESAFLKKIEGIRHPLLCANLRRKDGSLVLSDRLVVDVGGLRVGIFGVMVPIVTSKMATRVASAYLWDPPLPTAARVADEMRPEVDVLIALTHIGYRQDVEIARLGVGIDIILGGHSHTLLDEPELVGATYICQGGSHGRFAGVYEWSDGKLTGGLQPLKP